MATTADATLLQELLQQDRRLAAFTVNEPATVPIEKLAGPSSFARPWQDLAATLPTPAPAEPLADAAPADFYFARFAGLPQLYRLLDGLDGWLSQATRAGGQRGGGSGIRQRDRDRSRARGAIPDRARLAFGRRGRGGAGAGDFR